MPAVKILAVDDELRTRELLREGLGAKGYEVTTVPRADQALAAMGEQVFDLILLDVNMPGESGTSFLQKIRQAQSKVPVVIYSGFINTKSEKELRAAGANEVLSKDTGIDPLAEQIAKIVRAKERIFQAPLERKEKAILIVDDEAGVRKLLVNFFGTKHYKTVEAENGTKAIELARSEKPSVVLLDVNMPGMDGLETLKRLLEMNPKLGVVMVTVEQDDKTVKEALAAGAYGYVLKPFDFLYLELVVMSKLVIAEAD